ncbi:MAG: hypothetical protein N2323_00945 [candidate division WOR-3 bacterium]|nr:hypothetical protein [candidate division WOR-3 bacterium]MCX7836512.1 hypothetical protein [candidate division WOR-3 bacterium]MDW8113750.1 hypothetical protein [candidate division WOR-3 bacterium]
MKRFWIVDFFINFPVYISPIISHNGFYYLTNQYGNFSKNLYDISPTIFFRDNLFHSIWIKSLEDNGYKLYYSIGRVDSFCIYQIKNSTLGDFGFKEGPYISVLFKRICLLSYWNGNFKRYQFSVRRFDNY